MNNMSVLIYTPSARIGGVEVWSFTFFLQLLKEGIDTTLFSGESGVLAENLSIENKKSFVIGTFAELICYLNENPVDIIHFPSQAIDDGAGFIKSLFPKIKVVVTCHGAIPIGWTSKNCDQIIACASWLSHSASTIAGVNVPYIYNGVDEEKFFYDDQKIKSTRPILLWVGRANDPIKNFMLFSTLIDDIKKLGMNIWVVSATTKEQLAEINLEDVMTKVDQWLSLPYDKMASIYQQVANSGGGLLMTSLREGLPMVAIEAQACGCPLIGPRHSGISDAAINKQLLFSSSVAKVEVLEKINDVISKTNENNLRDEDLSLKTLHTFGLKKMSIAYLEYYQHPKFKRHNFNMLIKLKRLVARFKYENFRFRKNIFNNIQPVIIALDKNNEGELAKSLRLIRYKYLIFK